jgi:membrane glycosyltransferase
VAVPFAVITASPAMGRLFQAWGLNGIPEDFETPAEVKAVLAKA